MGTDYVNKRIGVEISDDKICTLLSKMALPTKPKEAGMVDVEVGPTRHDVMHACDVMEDVAIAYGYDNIHKVRFQY